MSKWLMRTEAIETGSLTTDMIMARETTSPSETTQTSDNDK